MDPHSGHRIDPNIGPFMDPYIENRLDPHKDNWLDPLDPDLALGVTGNMQHHYLNSPPQSISVHSFH